MRRTGRNLSNQLAPSLRYATEERLQHCPRVPSFLQHRQGPRLPEAHQSWQRKLPRQCRAQLAATERSLRATERGLRATERGLRATVRGLRATGRQIWKLFFLASWTAADTIATSPPLPGNSALPAKVSEQWVVLRFKSDSILRYLVILGCVLFWCDCELAWNLKLIFF